MATPKPPYDPVRALEGMFNGSITRLGYLLKDPVGYGRDTKVVLAECAKKFHDALDDCEIQLLDAKWYLEHQLTQNRLRREAKAREAGSAMKRKHEQTKEAGEPEVQDETPSKRAKIEEGKDQVKPQTPQQTNKEKLETGKKEEKTPLSAQKSPNVRKEEQKPTDNAQVEKPAEPVKQDPKVPPQQQRSPQPQLQQQNQDDFSKPTPPQDTPIDTSDEFNFTSMFGDPTADQYQDNKETNEFDFSLGLDNSFISGDGTDAFGDLTGDNDDDNNNNNSNNNNNNNNDPTSLDSILPGLETYANQTGDDNNNNNNNNNSSNNNNKNTAADATTTAGDGAIPDFTNDFDLPDITAPNDFDDLLNDDTLGGGGNYDGNFDLSDAALDNMDFDDDLFG